MAYFSQEQKKQLSPAIKAICKKYGIKASIAVDNGATLVLNIKSGKIDFIGNFQETTNKSVDNDGCLSINPYWFKEHFSGEAKDFLTEVLVAMNIGNFDNSDIQSDYFHVGWYTDISIGRWDRPYIIE